MLKQTLKIASRSCRITFFFLIATEESVTTLHLKTVCQIQKAFELGTLLAYIPHEFEESERQYLKQDIDSR